MIRLSLLCVMMLAASACGSSTSSKPQSCAITGSNWHSGKPEPPYHVIVADVRLVSKGVELNGQPMNEQDLLSQLQKLRELRPSPYLMLSNDPRVSCLEL